MPIIHFSRNRADIPANAANVRLTTNWRDAVRTDVSMDVPEGDHPGDLWLWDTHIGLCLEDREENGYNDSDFYMMVWNPETKAPERVTFASTRGWSYPAYGSSVDATPEVQQAYAEWKQQASERARKLRVEREARTPSEGKRIRVIGGRKLPKGTLATVRWVGQSRRFRSRYDVPAIRVGLEPDGHTGRGYVFVNADQVEVI